MHATTEQLLEIKDGLDNQANIHVENCEACKAELNALLNLNKQIFDQANQEVPEEIWQRIRGTVELNTHMGDVTNEHNFQPETVPVELLIPNKPASFNPLSRAIYTLAASILVIGFIGLYLFNQNSASVQQTQLLQANINELMLNSRSMEQALQRVALQNEALTASERSVAERLYWRLTYVDQMINENDLDNQLDAERTKHLWTERIDTLTELSQLYYQRQQSLDDSEI